MVSNAKILINGPTIYVREFPYMPIVRAPGPVAHDNVLLHTVDPRAPKLYSCGSWQVEAYRIPLRYLWCTYEIRMEAFNLKTWPSSLACNNMTTLQLIHWIRGISIPAQGQKRMRRRGRDKVNQNSSYLVVNQLYTIKLETVKWLLKEMVEVIPSGNLNSW